MLTPLAVDQGHPFPALPDHGLSLAVVLIKSRRGIARRDVTLAIVSMPPGIPRLVELGLTSEGAKGFVLLDEAVAMHIGELFPGFRISSCCALRITRRRIPALGCSRRPNRGVAVRLEIAAGAPAEVEALLRAALHLEAPDVYRVDGPVGLDDLSKLRAYVDAPSA